MTGVPGHWRWRIAGTAALVALLVVYEPSAGGLLQRLVLPVAMGLAAWLIVQNLFAVVLTGGALALLHADPGSADWISARGFPAIGGLCLVTAVSIWIARFRRRIRETRAARWSSRGGPPRDPDD